MQNTNENKIKLILIRHGATIWNVEKRYMGQTDLHLSDAGKAQIKELADSGIYPEIDGLFISPLSRCRETANIIYPNMEPVAIDELKEMDFGDFEGKNYNDLSDNPVYQAYIDSNGELEFPNGENKHDFSKRVMAGLGKVIKIAIDNNLKTVACVVHGGTTMAACAGLNLAEYFDSIVGNGGKLEIEITYDLPFSGVYSGRLI